MKQAFVFLLALFSSCLKTSSFIFSNQILISKFSNTDGNHRQTCTMKEIVSSSEEHIKERDDSMNAGFSRRAFLTSVSASALVVAGTSQLGLQQASATAATIPVSESPFLTAAASTEASTELVSGLLAGAASRISKELLLHPLDTIKSRLQYKEGSRVITPELFQDLYNGLLPPIIAGAPAGAVFFGVKDYVKTIAGGVLGEEKRQLSTILAVLAAQFPYWAIRSPSELIKTRRQTGLAQNGTVAALTEIYEEEGFKGVYKGYQTNIIYAYPTDVIKFLIYDTVKQQWKTKTGKKLNPVEAAVAGALSSATAQVCSTPLDVARTRILTREKGSNSNSSSSNVFPVIAEIFNNEGFGALFAGVTTRILRSLGSGAIQFSSYEIIKGLFGEQAAKAFKK